MKKLSIKALLFATLIFTLITSCEQLNSTSRNEVRMENEPTEENIRDDWKVEQEALRTKLDQARDRLDNLITSLENDAEAAKNYTEEEVEQQIKDLKQRKKLIETDLEQINNQVADNWDEFKANVGQHIEEAIKQIEENI